MPTSWTRLLLCLALLCLSAPNVVFAATNPAEQELIRDRQNRLLEEQQRRLEELKELPGKAIKPQTPAAPVEARCFPVRHLELKGAQSLSDDERERLIKPYKNQCLGVSRLNELLKRITDTYIDKGLLTSRAYLPQQDLSNGHLQVLVAEGKLEALTSADNSTLSERELAMTFPGNNGNLLNLREIEQALDQLNRLPSNQAHMELAPGSAVGGSKVVVKNTPQKPWRASLSRNNDGQKSTGEQLGHRF